VEAVIVELNKVLEDFPAQAEQLLQLIAPAAVVVCVAIKVEQEWLE